MTPSKDRKKTARPIAQMALASEYEGPRNGNGQKRNVPTMNQSSNHKLALFNRHVKNPLLTAADWPYPINTVFNAGATLLQDGRTLLLCRVEDHRGHSHLCAARSKNGIDGWEIDPAPTMMPDRKSTRLNSSHITISYAVFCLKKKKK